MSLSDEPAADDSSYANPWLGEPGRHQKSVAALVFPAIRNTVFRMRRDVRCQLWPLFGALLRILCMRYNERTISIPILTQSQVKLSLFCSRILLVFLDPILGIDLKGRPLELTLSTE